MLEVLHQNRQEGCEHEIDVLMDITANFEGR
jgi:hypothetical protein